MFLVAGISFWAIATLVLLVLFIVYAVKNANCQDELAKSEAASAALAAEQQQSSEEISALTNGTEL